MIETGDTVLQVGVGCMHFQRWALYLCVVGAGASVVDWVRPDVCMYMYIVEIGTCWCRARLAMMIALCAICVYLVTCVAHAIEIEVLAVLFHGK